MRKNVMHLTLCAMLFALCAPAEAQQTKRVYRIGYLSVRSAESERQRFPVFQQGLQELGYVEGKNIVIEFRRAAGQRERLREVAAELVRLNVDVIVATGDDSAHIAKEATATIPIVFTVSPDPVGTGLVQSLARPGGNATGLSDLHSVLVTKRLELLKEVASSASRIAFLWNSASTSGLLQLKDIQAAAPAVGVTVLSLPVTGPDDLDRAFATIKKERPGGLVIHGNPLFGTQIVARVARSRLPHVFTTSGNVDAGGLMSYGAHFPDLWRRAATYVDKILKGAIPADLPVEQPTKFEFVVNLKTAKQIGLTIPPNVLARADRVIR